MFLKQTQITTEHIRQSKTGRPHTYSRKKTILEFRCDNCRTEFTRDKGSMDPKRVNNNVYHVCSECDAKKFAQSKGIESKHIWDMPVSSLKTLGQL